MAPLLSWGAALAGAALLYGKTVDLAGEFTFPLDDAYIHLGVAKTLAASGTWGVNPGEFASASSSPLWTALLALGFAFVRPDPAVALVLNAASLGLVCFGADRLLGEPTGRGVGRMLGLGLLLLAVPLPFLAGLGMEHTLHLGLALALVIAWERERGVAPVAILAALATLTRYETVFLVGGLAVAGGQGKRREALAAAAGSTLAITAFGLFSVAHGGAFLPNPILKKAWVGRDWLSGLREVWTDGQGLIALVVVAILGVALGLPAKQRRRAVAFVVAACGQMILGRIGWLYRYEAWLIGFGVIVLAGVSGGLFRRGPVIVAFWLLNLSLPPLLVRAGAAWTSYAPGARLTLDADVLPARWLASEFGGVPAAVHDLGAASFYTDNPLVDVGGLGSDEVARLLREGRLSGDTLDPILRAHGVGVAITGPEWLGDARPIPIEEAGRIIAPYPAFPGTFDTVVWAVDPGRLPEISASLENSSLWSSRVEVRLPSDVVVPLSTAQLEGRAVVLESNRIAFYTDGTATFRLPAAGVVRLSFGADEAGDTDAEVRWDLLKLAIAPSRPISERVLDEATHVPAEGIVVQTREPGRAGDILRVKFADDTVISGQDRNLFLRSVVVR